MREPFSQTERALRDTLISKAETFALDRLGVLYGLPRVPVIQRAYWRQLLRAAALGPRDRFGTIWAAVEALLGQWTDPLLTFPVSLSTGAPNAITAAGAWTCAHVGRFIRVGDLGVYWSTGFSGFDLTLDDKGTSVWRGANWTENRNVEAKVLPFWIRDFGAVVDVLIDAELFTVPPTYLQPNAVDPRPAGQPIGGEIVTDATVNGATHRPLYLPGDELRGVLRAVLDSLCAAGVQVSLRAVEGCPTAGLGLGTLGDLLARGRVGGPGVFVPPSNWS